MSTRFCALEHPEVSYDAELHDCPVCAERKDANFWAKSDADLIRKLRQEIISMKERCICGKLAE